MHRPTLVVVTLILVAALSWPAGAEDGWFTKLNPFATKSKSKSPPTRKVSESKSSGFSLNPFAKSSSSTKSKSSSRRKNEPSTLTKTWQAITPWEENPKPKSVTGYGASSKAKKKSKKDDGWFTGWFGNDEPKQPETVDSWILQDRPGF